MSDCVNRETLLAFVDGELAASETASVERHIAGCAACRLELDRVRATTIRVDSFLNSLAPAEAPAASPYMAPIAPPKPSSSWIRWAATASLGALAAASLLFFITFRRSHTPRNPPANVVVAKIQAPPPISISAPESHNAAPSQKPPQPHIRAARPAENDFMPLDDGPPVVDGTIARITLPASLAIDPARARRGKGIPADVLVDEWGQVRAIRFVN